MADITMCNNTECPLRMDCYRYRAKPNEYRQSYFVDVKPDENGNCKERWPIVDGKINGYDCSSSIAYNVK